MAQGFQVVGASLDSEQEELEAADEELRCEECYAGGFEGDKIEQIIDERRAITTGDTTLAMVSEVESHSRTSLSYRSRCYYCVREM